MSKEKKESKAFLLAKTLIKMIVSVISRILGLSNDITHDCVRLCKSANRHIHKYIYIHSTQ